MYLKVHVGTNCKEEKLDPPTRGYGVARTKARDYFIIHVKEKPERGLANKRVVEMLRKHFGKKAKAIRIVSGYDSPSKLISVDFENSVNVAG